MRRANFSLLRHKINDAIKQTLITKTIFCELPREKNRV